MSAVVMWSAQPCVLRVKVCVPMQCNTMKQGQIEGDSSVEGGGATRDDDAVASAATPQGDSLANQCQSLITILSTAFCAAPCHELNCRSLHVTSSAHEVPSYSVKIIYSICHDRDEILDLF